MSNQDQVLFVVQSLPNMDFDGRMNRVLGSIMLAGVRSPNPAKNTSTS